MDVGRRWEQVRERERQYVSEESVLCAWSGAREVKQPQSPDPRRAAAVAVVVIRKQGVGILVPCGPYLQGGE